jgi:hypothetical protein
MLYEWLKASGHTMDDRFCTTVSAVVLLWHTPWLLLQTMMPQHVIHKFVHQH